MAERIPKRGKRVNTDQKSVKSLANLDLVAPCAALIRLCFDFISFALSAISSKGSGPTPLAICDGWIAPEPSSNAVSFSYLTVSLERSPANWSSTSVLTVVVNPARPL